MNNKYVHIITEHFYDGNDDETGTYIIGVASALDKADYLRSAGCHSNISNITVDTYIVDEGVPENYSELTLYPIYKIVFDKTLRFCNSIKVVGYTRYPDDFSYYPRWDITEHFFSVFIIGKNETEKQVAKSALNYLKQQLELAIKSEAIFNG